MRDRIYRRSQVERRKKKIQKRFSWLIAEYNQRLDDHNQGYVTAFSFRGSRVITQAIYCHCNYTLEDTKTYTPTFMGYINYLNDRESDFFNVVNTATGAEFHTCEESERWLKRVIGRSSTHNDGKDPRAKESWPPKNKQIISAKLKFAEQLQDLNNEVEEALLDYYWRRMYEDM